MGGCSLPLRNIPTLKAAGSLRGRLFFDAASAIAVIACGVITVALAAWVIFSIYSSRTSAPLQIYEYTPGARRAHDF